jgi:hypothetical protein
LRIIAVTYQTRFPDLGELETRISDLPGETKAGLDPQQIEKMLSLSGYEATFHRVTICDLHLRVKGIAKPSSASDRNCAYRS